MPHLSERLFSSFFSMASLLSSSRTDSNRERRQRERITAWQEPLLETVQFLSSSIGGLGHFSPFEWLTVCLEWLYRVSSGCWTASAVHDLQTSSEMLGFQVSSDAPGGLHSDLLFRFETEIEPMFFTLALFDYKERKKVRDARRAERGENDSFVRSFRSRRISTSISIRMLWNKWFIFVQRSMARRWVSRRSFPSRFPRPIFIWSFAFVLSLGILRLTLRSVSLGGKGSTTGRPVRVCRTLSQSR